MQVRFSIAFTANQLGIEIVNVNNWYEVIDETHGKLTDNKDDDKTYIPAPSIKQMCDYLENKHQITISNISNGVFDVPNEGSIELFCPVIKDDKGECILVDFECDDYNDVLQNGIEWTLNRLDI